MRVFLRRFAEKKPMLHLFVVGFGGMIAITTVIDLVLYAVGGITLMRRLGFISIGCGVLWFIPQLFDFQFRMGLRDFEAKTREAFKAKM